MPSCLQPADRSGQVAAEVVVAQADRCIGLGCLQQQRMAVGQRHVGHLERPDTAQGRWPGAARQKPMAGPRMAGPTGAGPGSRWAEEAARTGGLKRKRLASERDARTAPALMRQSQLLVLA